MGEFLNEDRTRYYGLRVGDTVELKAFGSAVVGKVTELHLTDNNGCTIETPVGKRHAVCEWCEIIKKVEDS